MKKLIFIVLSLLIISCAKEKNGKQTSYYENGKISKEENYKDGIKDGKWNLYYRSGKVKGEGNYKNGKKVGKQTSYYENGKVEIESNFQDGRLDGKWRFYFKNERVKFEKNFNDGKLDGKQTSYYENGKISKEENYKSRQKNGKQTSYYENGKISKEENYKDGIKDGRWTSYYENGKVKSEKNYKDGKERDSKELSNSWFKYSVNKLEDELTRIMTKKDSDGNNVYQYAAKSTWTEKIGWTSAAGKIFYQPNGYGSATIRTGTYGGTRPVSHSEEGSWKIQWSPATNSSPLNSDIIFTIQGSGKFSHHIGADNTLWTPMEEFLKNNFNDRDVDRMIYFADSLRKIFMKEYKCSIGNDGRFK